MKIKESEHQIQTRIMNMLNAVGHHVIRINAGAVKVGTGRYARMIRLAPRGTSDLIGIHCGTGQFMALEVKTPARKKNVTVHQRAFLDTIEQRGGIARVVSCDEDIQDLL